MQRHGGLQRVRRKTRRADVGIGPYTRPSVDIP